MADPKTDDFRIEPEGDRLLLTFTPTGAKYAFAVKDDGSTQLVDEESRRADTSGYAEEDVRRMASQLASLAVSERSRA